MPCRRRNGRISQRSRGGWWLDQSSNSGAASTCWQPPRSKQPVAATTRCWFAMAVAVAFVLALLLLVMVVMLLLALLHIKSAVILASGVYVCQYSNGLNEYEKARVRRSCGSAVGCAAGSGW